MKNHFVFIVNPISGTGRQKHIEEIIAENINPERYTFSIHYTERPHHGVELSRQAASREETYAVVAVGGDGTINDVVSGLDGTDVPMGIVPCGSGNGLARYLNLPMNTAAAVRTLTSGSPVEVDTITVNEVVYASIAGIGFDALVARKMTEARKRGLQAYANIVINDYPLSQEHTYHLFIDGREVIKRAWFISFANSNQFGYNTAIAPQAKLDDGLIDICFVDKIPLVHLPLTAPLLYLNHFDVSQHVEIIQAREVKVMNNDDEWVNVDGEAMKLGRELSFVNRPKTLRVICAGKARRPNIFENINGRISSLEHELRSRIEHFSQK